MIIYHVVHPRRNNMKKYIYSFGSDAIPTLGPAWKLRLSSRMVGLRRTRRGGRRCPVGRSSVAGVAPETRPDRLRPSETIATPASCDCDPMVSMYMIRMYTIRRFETQAFCRSLFAAGRSAESSAAAGLDAASQF